MDQYKLEALDRKCQSLSQDNDSLRLDNLKLIQEADEIQKMLSQQVAANKQ